MSALVPRGDIGVNDTIHLLGHTAFIRREIFGADIHRGKPAFNDIAMHVAHDLEMAGMHCQPEKTTLPFVTR